MVALDAFKHWIAQFASSATAHPDRAPQCEHLIQRIVHSTVSFILSATENVRRLVHIRAAA